MKEGEVLSRGHDAIRGDEGGADADRPKARLLASGRFFERSRREEEEEGEEVYAGQGQLGKDGGGVGGVAGGEVALGVIRICCFLGRFPPTSSSTFLALIDLLRRAVSGSGGRKRIGGEGEKKKKNKNGDNEAFQIALLVLLRHFAGRPLVTTRGRRVRERKRKTSLSLLELSTHEVFLRFLRGACYGCL